MPAPSTEKAEESMQYQTTFNDTDIELRVLELEDTVTALVSIISTMTEMLGRLNEITGHYADTVTGALRSLPSQAQNILPLLGTGVSPSGCDGAEECARCVCTPSGP